MTTILHKLVRLVFPEQPVDLLEEPHLLPMDFESLC
jgi:hypothetical protein